MLLRIGHVPASPARLATLLLALFLCAGSTSFGQSAPPLHEPEQFLTEVADALLQQQLGMRLRDVQIAPTNQYDSAVHRILQVTANIYEATTTNRRPAVFRPSVESRSNGVFLAGFTNDPRVSTLAAWLDANTNGLPLVIGAKKGLPGFNEFTMRSDFLVQRKLQLTRPNSAPGTRPTGTNQMYMLSLSNCFGVEAWNPGDISRQGPYPRPLSISISNLVTIVLSNEAGLQTNQTLTIGGTTNLPANSWNGGVTRGFILPLNDTTVLLRDAAYRFGDNSFSGPTNVFETLPGFPRPEWIFGISNRLTFLISEPDDGEGDGRIIDFVLLHDAQTVDLKRDPVEAPSPYAGIAGIPDSTC